MTARASGGGRGIAITLWACDFVQARTHDGRVSRLLVLVDEHTRECLAIDVARRLSSEDVLERLAFQFATRGVPEHLRSGGGTEFTSKAVREWLANVGVKTLFVEPGSPWENRSTASCATSCQIA